MTELLTRDQFRTAVFERDHYKCVVCQAPGQDAHHIMERRLFDDGGYYLDNGATVCGRCHLQAEQTMILSPDDLRRHAQIKRVVLPEHMYSDQVYDKWGNPVLPNGMRLRGELFQDVSVQRVLAPVLHLFTNRVKYPRTHHLPWSPGKTSDDRVLTDLSAFVGQEVVVTAKMDGENTTLYQDYVHARSLEYEAHPSRSRVKALQAIVGPDIPPDWRVCGENLFAKHSIGYSHLGAFFQVFSVWNQVNTCLSWDETVEWAELLGLATVPVLYRGLWDERAIRPLWQPVLHGDEMEGYVVRVASSFNYGQFRAHAAKYVRASHVTSHGHWMRSAMTPNKVETP